MQEEKFQKYTQKRAEANNYSCASACGVIKIKNF